MWKKVSLTALCVAVLAGGCSGSNTPAPVAAPTSVTPQPTLPPAGNGASHAQGAEVVRARSATLLLGRHPFDPPQVQWRFPARNAFGQAVSFLVTDTRTAADGALWLRIQLGVKPNEVTAWVPRTEVKVSRVHDRVVVDLSQRTLSHYRDGKLVQRFSVGVGQPQWPTTPGSYFIWAKVPQASPSGPYGVYALGLSGFSTVLTDWPGGGRMAIHGTANASDKGQQVSHGCIRVFNSDMEKLKQLPMGTPVIIQK